MLSILADHPLPTHQEVALHVALGRDHPDSDDQVLYVAVDVLLHPGGASSHPSSQTAELQGVWLVT